MRLQRGSRQLEAYIEPRRRPGLPPRTRAIRRKMTALQPAMEVEMNVGRMRFGQTAFLACMLTGTCCATPRLIEAGSNTAGSSKSVVWLKGHDRDVYSLVFAPSGVLVSADRNRINLWEPTKGNDPVALDGDNVFKLAVDPKGRVLASGGSSKREAITLWNLRKCKETARFGCEGKHVLSMAFSSDGKTLATCTTGSYLTLWEVASGKARKSLKAENECCPQDVKFSPDDKYLAWMTGENAVGLWDYWQDKEPEKLVSKEDQCVISVSFSPCGTLLAAGNSDGNITLWNVADRTEIATMRGHQDFIYSLAFSPDGRTIASGSMDKTIRLWDVAKREHRATLKGHTDTVWSVAFHPDGTLLASGSADNTIGLWRLSAFQAK